jgi:hypothetical protein
MTQRAPLIATILRVLFGLAFLVFGLNYFLQFLPPMDPPPPEALTFLGALVSAKLMALVKVVEIAAGLLLLTNRFVPLALLLLAPIVVGINGFHFALAPAGSGPAVAMLVLELVLAWLYRDAFAVVLRPRHTPRGAAAAPVATAP